MGTIIRWVAAVWPKLPKEIRYAILAALVLAVVAATVTLSCLAWRDGFIQQKLGGVATNDHITNEFNTLKQDVSQQMDQKLAAGFAQFTDSLQMERRKAEDSVQVNVVEPIQSHLDRVDRTLSSIKMNTGTALDMIDALPTPNNDALDRIEENTNNTEVLYLLRQLATGLDSVKTTLKKGGRGGKPMKF